jgi:hypothetical membrane protein
MNERFASSVRIKTWLFCGLVSGPLFMTVNVMQILTTEGFDFWKHPVSLLMAAPLGGIQIANFLVGGVLTLVFAVALRRLHRGERGGFWGPLFIAGFGLGLVIGGIFPPDPALGFPPGTSEGVPAVVSYKSTLHGLGFTLAFASLTAACVVSARGSAAQKKWGWAIYSVATAATSLTLAMWPGLGGIGARDFAAAALAWLWTTLLAAKFLKETRKRG